MKPILAYIFIITSSLQINRKILLLMRKTILNYQYFSTFLKKEVSVSVFENQILSIIISILILGKYTET